MSKVGAKPGVKKSAKHKAAISKAQEGKDNSNWKHGKRIEYRRKLGLKPNDGKIANHISGKRHGIAANKKSNLEVINDKPKPGSKLAGRTNSSKHAKHTWRVVRKNK